jgi:hypothetical protein
MRDDTDERQRRRAREDEYEEYSPPRRTASPEPLDTRESRRSERWDRERFETERGQNRDTEPYVRERFVGLRERNRARYDRDIESAKNKLEYLRTKKKEATRQGDDSRAADLQYYSIQEQEALLKTLEKNKEIEERNRTYYDDQSRARARSRSRGRYREPEIRIEREREREYYDYPPPPLSRYGERIVDPKYYGSPPPSPPVRERYREPEIERDHSYHRTHNPRVVTSERDERREEYEPPESGGKSLKFDVNLLSLFNDIKNDQMTKVPRPNKTPSTDKPEIVSIETSRRYTGDSDGETVVLTTSLKAQSSLPGHLRWM